MHTEHRSIYQNSELNAPRHTEHIPIDQNSELNAPRHTEHRSIGYVASFV